MEKNRCEKCGKILEDVNFCPECGTAISEIAKSLKIENEISIKLETVKDIIALTKDVETLNFLKAYAKNILEKK